MPHLGEIRKHLAKAYEYRNYARRNVRGGDIRNLERALTALETVSWNITRSQVLIQQEIAERKRCLELRPWPRKKNIQ